MSLLPSAQLTFGCNCGAVCDLPGNMNAFFFSFFFFSFFFFSSFFSPLSQLPKLLTSFLFFSVALSVSESASGLIFSAAVQSLIISFADG